MRQKAEAAARGQHRGDGGQGAVQVVYVLQDIHGKDEVERPFDPRTRQVLPRAAVILNRQSGAGGVTRRCLGTSIAVSKKVNHSGPILPK